MAREIMRTLLVLCVLSVALIASISLEAVEARCSEDTSFSSKCTHIQLVDFANGFTLQATCSYIDESSGTIQHAQSQIYINDHVENVNGRLFCHLCSSKFGWPEKCEFSHSCTNVQLLDGHQLAADCGDGHGSRPHATLDLDLCIGVSEMGELQWDCSMF